MNKTRNVDALRKTPESSEREHLKRERLKLGCWKLGRWDMARWGMAIASVGFGGAIAPETSVALTETIATPSPLSIAQQVPELSGGPPGLCYLSERDVAGRWITDGEGNVVSLATVCQTAFTIQESRRQDNGAVVLLSPEERTFWQAFSTAASPEAWEFAASLDTEAVMVYGEAICLSLAQGESMHEVRVLQIEGGLPPSFDAAVNVAAIHTYCPQYSAVIGR